LSDIDTPYELAPELIVSFRERGFVKLKDVLSEETLVHYGAEIREKVQELNKNKAPMAERTTYKQAFIQIINLWQKSEAVRTFVFGKRLARIATELMGTEGVRVYHDQALFKEAGGGFTPWHADQFYWPFASEKCCSVWVPLQETPLEMGPMGFAEGSHRFETGRDLGISDESETVIGAALQEGGYSCIYSPYVLGEVSFHAGWTFHRADGNRTAGVREAMTMIYMDKEMRMKEEDNEHQQAAVWCPGVEVGEVIDTPQTPVVYTKARATENTEEHGG
jgi:ectoine hydroxylase-related dioxygenase (phytanoyl-CoA dioxygenase family)